MKNKIWLVSFPRSGNTWMRFLLANLLYPEEDVNYKSLNRLAPDFHQHKHWEALGVRKPLVIKSHYVWMPRYEKVIYIYRDVRDVALSHYYFSHVKRNEGREEKERTFGEYLEKVFIEGEPWGRPPWGGWDRHVWFWASGKPDVPFILIKYEELWQHPYEELKRIIEFLGVDVKHTADIQIVINKSNFDELEKIRARDGVHPKAKGLRGRPGGWKKNLTEEQKELIWKEFGRTMERLGYKKGEGK